jgi:predicted TIM-barrel fold metal-dependent hydrolase
MNDDLAAVAARRPDRFSAVALLPTTTPEIMLAEFRRAVKDLGMAGGMFVVGPTVKRPDHPDYEALYAEAQRLDVPLWLHPSRPPLYPDYADETDSRFQIWQTLSWLQDSSAAMVRIVFAGVFERHPGLKLVIHHHGALVPLFAQRMQYGWDYFEQNTGVTQPTAVSRPYIAHFKKFYCDTATQGREPKLLEMAVAFFGPERVLFGTDAPMDASAGRSFTEDAIASVEGMNLSGQDKERLFRTNALRLLKMG